MTSDNVELVRRGLAALNRGDADELAALADPTIEASMLGVAETPVRYTGIEGIRQYFRDMAESWQSFEFIAEEVRDLGDCVLVTGRQRSRGRVSGAEVEGQIASVVEIRDGKVVALRSYLTAEEAARNARAR